MMIKILMLMFGMNAMSATNFVSHNNEPRGFWANRDAVSMLTGGLSSMGLVCCLNFMKSGSADKLVPYLGAYLCFFALFCVINYFLYSNDGKWFIVSCCISAIITFVVVVSCNIAICPQSTLLLKVLTFIFFPITQYIEFALLENVGFITPTNTFLSKIINLNAYF